MSNFNSDMVVSRMRRFVQQGDLAASILGSHFIRAVNGTNISKRKAHRITECLKQAFRQRFREEMLDNYWRRPGQDHVWFLNQVESKGYEGLVASSYLAQELISLPFGQRAYNELITEIRASKISPTEAIKRLKRFCDAGVAASILRGGFIDMLCTGKTSRGSRRFMIDQLKRGFDLRFQAMLVADEQFQQVVAEQGYVAAIKQSSLAEDLLFFGSLGKRVLSSMLQEFQVKDNRAKARAYKQERSQIRRAVQPKVKQLSRSQIRREKIVIRQKLRRAESRAKQKCKQDRVLQKPFELVLVSETFVDLEQNIFDPVSAGHPAGLRTNTTMSFSLHLGKNVGGELFGPSLVGGYYEGGTDLRIVCHWNRSKTGPEAFRFKIKKMAVSNTSCATWHRSEVRNIDSLPPGLQTLLWRTFSDRAPHYVQHVPNIYRFPKWSFG